jgi:hypothetical protein
MSSQVFSQTQRTYIYENLVIFASELEFIIQCIVLHIAIKN